VAGAAASFEVLRAAARVAVPWKNGGGLTREVAVHPSGSGLGDFDWRISIAEIAAPGPFSVFPGIERRMAILSGRLLLMIDGRSPTALTAESPAVEFPGDAAAFAEPERGPVTDLNVMTRRARCRAELTRHDVRRPTPLEPRDGATLVMVALTGQVLLCSDTSCELRPLDAVLLWPGSPAVTAAAHGAASFHLVEIRPREPGNPQ
jgi:uncharacterized protein